MIRHGSSKKGNTAEYKTWTIYQKAIFVVRGLSLTWPITFAASSSPDFGSLSAWSWALGPFAPSLPLTGRNWNDKISEIMQTEARGETEKTEETKKANICTERKIAESQPGQSVKRQFLVSVGFPGQEPWLPLQALALTLCPLSHVVEQWDQGPHFCHLLGLTGPEMRWLRRRKSAEETTWTLSLLAIFCLCMLS